jgi:glycosyltransferase involved in cell wall biosynthesis
VEDPNSHVFFVCKHANKKWRDKFDRNAKTYDLSWLLASPLKYPLYFIVMGALIELINQQKMPVVFGCNNGFFYRMLPHLGSHVKCIDLTHSLLDDSRMPYIRYLDNRIAINQKVFEDITNQYKKYCVSNTFLNRITTIENFTNLPEHKPSKNNKTLQILYIGRGTEEKRVHLIGKAATLCRKKKIPVSFTLVGNVDEVVNSEDKKSCTILGEITNERAIEEIYNSADILLLVSSREGFPLVVMEAMAHAVIPLCTDVGGIPYHISNNYNGILIDSTLDDSSIVMFIKDAITQIVSNNELRNNLSQNAFNYASSYFTYSSFRQAYRNILRF